MSTLLYDLRYALRLLRKNPLFTFIAVFTLALGIGLNTAVFSAIEALLLRPLPGVDQPDQLVQLYRNYPGFEYGSNSVPHYLDVRNRGTDAFSGVAVWDYAPVNLSAGGRTERIFAQMVSANFFTVLGARIERGRGFTADEDTKPGAHPVAVVSHAAWQGLFGADPQIVGRTILLNGHRYTVVGVTEPAFRGPVPIVAPMMWVPLMQVAEIEPGHARSLDSRDWSYLSVIARLKPGVTPDAARDRMKALVAQLRELYPDQYKQSGILLLTQAEGGIHPKFKGAQVGLSSVMMVVVFLLLLIACVNVANLFLARARHRSREMAVRLSLGAGRSRLVRQLLTESLVFSLVAGAAGVVVGWGVIGIVNHIRLPIAIPVDADLRLSVPVLAFALVVSLVTGLLFGLAPALQATRPSLVPALKGEAPAGGARSRMSRPLVVAQMALSLILLVCSGLFLRNLRAATQLDKGFTSDGALIASLDPGLQGYDRARASVFFGRLVERLRAMPSVRAVGLGEQLPLGLGSSQMGIAVPGYTPAPNENMAIDYNIVTPGYFAAMGIRLLAGREFSARDDSSAQGALIVNQRFVDRFWPGQNPIGKEVRVGSRPRTIVGFTPNGKYHTLGEAPLAMMYFPQEQSWTSQMTVVVRTAGDPTALAPRLRAEVAALDPDLPVSDLQTLNSYLGIALFPARLAGSVLGIFGLLGLMLAVIGIYGVMSYSVAQRTREIGIRMAIGAASGEVVRLVMRQGLQLVVIGTLIGLAGALAAARLLRGLLYGEHALDPLSFVTVTVVLLGTAGVAIWIPARRAASTDPMKALRTE